MHIQNRNIVTCVLLSLLTCGLYSIYWFVVMTDDVAAISEDISVSGVKSLVFGLLTCGIYIYYWNYKMGQLLFDAKARKGEFADNKALLFLILAFCGLSIVNYCIIQDELNKWADTYKGI